MKKQFDIMNHVDLLDRVNVIVSQPIPGHFSVDFQSIDKTKQVVIDSSALQVMNSKITEKSKKMKSTDPNTREFIKEFAGRLLSELFRVELAVLEEIKEAPQDPYSEIKKNYRLN